MREAAETGHIKIKAAPLARISRHEPGAPRRALCACVQGKLTHDLRALLEKPTPRLVTWRSSVLSEIVHSTHRKIGQIGRIAVCC